MLSGNPPFPEQASTIVSDVDKLYFLAVAVTAFFALLVVISVVVFAIKYRERTGDRVGAPITGVIPLELGWSIVPFFSSMAIFGWATVVFFDLVRAPDQTAEIHSTGIGRGEQRFQFNEEGLISLIEYIKSIPSGQPLAAPADASTAQVGQGEPR